MDLKDPKTQKFVIALLAAFVVVYLWYSRVYQSYDAKIDMKSQEFETITTDLKNVEMKAKSLEALKLEYGDLLKRYNEIEALLPEVKQIPSMLVQLHTASAITGARITKLEPQQIGSEEFYNIASYNIEMTGTYHDFGQFISYVANFPFIANVSNMNIKTQNVSITKAGQANVESPSKPMEIGKKKETITASFTLSTYYVKEEERLKEVVL